MDERVWCNPTVKWPMPDPEAVRSVIRDAAARAIMPYFGALQSADVRTKSHAQDFVTVADIESERLLSDALTEMVPGSLVVGEEAAEADHSVISALGGDRPVWILDPVDGTANFVKGRPHFAVVVAYFAQGATRAGWIFEPVSGRFVWALAGGGAWAEEREGGARRVRLVGAKDFTDLVGFLGGPSSERLRKVVASGEVWAPTRIDRLGSTGSEYIALALGSHDFAHYIRLKPWDHAAGVLIHAEAGGYSGLRHGLGPYRPGPEIAKATLLLTPDEAAWHALDALL